MKKLVSEKRRANNKFEEGKCMNDCFKWYPTTSNIYNQTS